MQVTDSVITFIDAVFHLRKFKFKMFTSVQIRHFQATCVETDLMVLVFLQRHCKRRQDSVPKVLRTREDQLHDRLVDIISNDLLCSARFRAIILAAEKKSQIFCRLCLTKVGLHHFVHAHMFLLRPDDPRQNESGPGHYFVSGQGNIYLCAKKVLRRILLRADAFDCASCLQLELKTYNSNDTFLKHLLQHHLPKPPVAPKQQAYIMSSIETYVRNMLKHQDSDPVFKNIGLERTLDTLDIIENRYSRQTESDLHQTQVLYNLTKNQNSPTNVLELLLHMIQEEQPSPLKEYHETVLRIALGHEDIEITQQKPSSLKTVLVSDEPYEYNLRFRSRNIVVFVGTRSLCPKPTRDIATVQLTDTVSYIPIHSSPDVATALRDNNVIADPPQEHLKLVLEELGHRIFIIEIDPYPPGKLEPCAYFLTKQILLLNTTSMRTVQTFPLFMVVSAPPPKMYETLSTQEITRRHQEAEKLAAITCYFNSTILIPLNGSFFPSYTPDGTDHRNKSCPIWSSSTNTLTKQAAKLLAEVITAYGVEINEIYTRSRKIKNQIIL